MAKVYLTRRAGFCSAHRLYRPEWSDQKNWDVYGKCSSEHGHGHNYVIEVTICGEIDPETDMVMNLTDLKAIMERAILDPFDHHNLSMDVPQLKGVNTTAENLAVVCWDLLLPHLPDGTLYEVKILETENNAAYYRGE